MIIYGSRKVELKDVAKIDVDIIALCVQDDEVEEVVEFLVAAIATRCLLEYGIPPEIS